VNPPRAPRSDIKSNRELPRIGLTANMKENRLHKILDKTVPSARPSRRNQSRQLPTLHRHPHPGRQTAFFPQRPPPWSVIILPSENHPAYDHHTRRLFDELQPKGALEEQLVQSLSDTSQRINRIAALETNLLALAIHEQSNNIDTAHPEVHTALAMAAAVREQARALSNLGSHEHRLSRQFEGTLQELREIQAERREKEKDQMEKAAKILQLHQAEETSYNSGEDGFVFSNDEIENSIRRNHRPREANHAYYASTA
jgi:flagellar biosynthesis GTPase FlhF